MSDGGPGSGRGRTGLAMVLGITAGLTLAGASLAAWAREVRVDDLAGVPIESVEPTLGVELSGLVLPLGVAAAALALSLALPIPAVRRSVGAVLILLGGLATVFAGRGVVSARDLGHGVETPAFVAVLAAVAVAVAGLLAIQPAPPPRPRLPSRYDLDEDEADAEWDLASAEEPDPGAGNDVLDGDEGEGAR